jgi:hypothetical protein
MLTEDGSLWVYGVGKDGMTAFPEYGIERLRQFVAYERAAGRAPFPTSQLPCIGKWWISGRRVAIATSIR